MTCWWRRMKARFSPITCLIAPGTRVRSPGSAGLVPTSWDPSNEQWGATQLQQRFEKKFRAS